MTGATLLVASLAAIQAVEQIPQPPLPAPPGAARGVSNDVIRVAQLPPDAKSVEQPHAADQAEPKGDAPTDDAARAYAKILGSGPVSPRGSATDLRVRTLAEAAAAASLTPPPPPAPQSPTPSLHTAPRS